MRKIETEFAFDIGDVVRLKAWNYTTDANVWLTRAGPYAPNSPSCVYQIIELLAQICEGGLQRKYGVRSVTQGGHTATTSLTFLESEIEKATPLPPAVSDEK